MTNKPKIKDFNAFFKNEPISSENNNFIQKRIVKKNKKPQQEVLRKIEEVIGYKFQNKNILQSAITHSSVSKINGCEFERLEFLGDRILNLSIAKMLFNEYSDMSESQMTPKLAHMISRETLFNISKEINLQNFAIFRCQNEEKKIFADMIEAIIAAIYIDSKNLIESEIFIKKYWKSLLKDTIYNPKSELQELLHKYKIETPEYINEKSDNEIFISKIIINLNNLKNCNKLTADLNSNSSSQLIITTIGEGKSIKIASTKAAENAIEKINEILNNFTII